MPSPLPWTWSGREVWRACVHVAQGEDLMPGTGVATGPSLELLPENSDKSEMLLLLAASWAVYFPGDYTTAK